jgi:hypothetical protein
LTAATASLLSALAPHLLGFLVSHVKDDRASAGIDELDRDRGSVSVVDLLSG